MKASEIVKKYDMLYESRKNWDDLWDDVLTYVVPERNTVNNEQTPGDNKHDNNKVFDGTAILANITLANALYSMLTNPTVQFFSLSTGDNLLDDDDEVAKYIADVEDKIHFFMHNSNFTQEAHPFYLDLGSVGTAQMLVMPDKEFTVRYKAVPCWTSVITLSDLGLVTGWFRKFEMSYAEIVEKWGMEVLDDDQKKCYEKSMDDRIWIIHGVYERKVYNEKNGSNKQFRFASHYTTYDKPRTLAESGFRTMPLINSRWEVLSNEVYGRSPGTASLPDVKMINAMKITTLTAAQKMIDPALNVPSDGYMMPINTYPGGLNFHRQGIPQRIEPIQTGGRIDFGFPLIQDVKETINRFFYIDKLQLPSQGPQMTATEVNERIDQALRLLGPAMGRQNFEFLRPTVDRTFDILDKAGKLPEAPEALKGKTLHTSYSSQIARAIRKGDANNAVNLVSFVAPLLQIDPNSMDLIDMDKLIKFVAKAWGIPYEVMNNNAQVRKLREERAQQQQQAAQAAQQNQEADNTQKVLTGAGQVQ